MNSTAHANEEFYGQMVEVDIHGTASLEEYHKLFPETQGLVSAAEKVRILVVMNDFDGWDAGSLWEQTKWDANRFDHIERVAVVGEQAWKECATSFSKPFTAASVRYFTNDQLDDARAWLNNMEKSPIGLWDGSEASGTKQP